MSPARPEDAGYDHGVFINCPFDNEYQGVFDAVVFAVFDCGYVARSALEVRDAGRVRIVNIIRLISECRYGIHDLSRTELDEVHQLPRFNMPLELGMFLGAQHLGADRQTQKSCLVLDTERYRYQKFCSDIAGQDVSAHGGDPEKAIRHVRHWLSAQAPDELLPGPKKLWARFQQFQRDLPRLCEVFRQDPEDLTFVDYSTLVQTWLEQKPW